MPKPVIWTVDGSPPIILSLKECGSSAIGGRRIPTKIRDFLGRNFVPHQWLNVETDETAKQLLGTTGAGVSSLPMVVFADGTFLSNPPIVEIARKLGLRTKAEFPDVGNIMLRTAGLRALCGQTNLSRPVIQLWDNTRLAGD
jgi:hypothetical protein